MNRLLIVLAFIIGLVLAHLWPLTGTPKASSTDIPTRVPSSHRTMQSDDWLKLQRNAEQAEEGSLAPSSVAPVIAPLPPVAAPDAVAQRPGAGTEQQSPSDIIISDEQNEKELARLAQMLRDSIAQQKAENNRLTVERILRAKRDFSAWKDTPDRNRGWMEKLSPEKDPAISDGAMSLADAAYEKDGSQVCGLDLIEQLPGGRDALEFYLARSVDESTADTDFKDVAYAVAAWNNSINAYPPKLIARLALLQAVSSRLAQKTVALYLLRTKSKG